MGVADAVFVAIFVGGDWDRKGLGIAIAGLAVAQKMTRCHLQLWIVGSGDQGRFIAMARTLGVSEKVRFFGTRGDVECLYQAADAFVLPTLYETFSMAAYEAAACGLPIVATRVSGVEELIGSEDAGVFVERTPESIGGALHRLLSEPDQARLLGLVARSRAEQFTWRRSTSAVLDLYRRFAKDGSPVHRSEAISGTSKPTEAAT
jgi:glycosyltransferase involved in cell wall biosynthesis